MSLDYEYNLKYRRIANPAERNKVKIISMLLFFVFLFSCKKTCNHILLNLRTQVIHSDCGNIDRVTMTIYSNDSYYATSYSINYSYRNSVYLSDFADFIDTVSQKKDLIKLSIFLDEKNEPKNFFYTSDYSILNTKDSVISIQEYFE